MDHYIAHDKMYVSTDCIIFGFDEGVLKLLVFKRRVDPLKGDWSLIGSFVKRNENVDKAAKRVLKEITGLDDIYMEQLKVYGHAKRDPGYRCVSIGQYALIRIDDHDKALVEKHGAKWYEFAQLPKLVLDHNVMVKDALEALRKKATYQSIGSELLPEKFTIPQLQRLYEVIYQKTIDPRNFRKKIMSFKILDQLDEKDMSTSKRGAYLYKFNQNIARSYKNVFKF